MKHRILVGRHTLQPLALALVLASTGTALAADAQAKLDQINQREQQLIEKLDGLKQREKYVETQLEQVRQRKEFLLKQQGVRNPAGEQRVTPSPAQ